MTPAEHDALERLAKLATHHAHLVVEAREAGDELGATRHDRILGDLCRVLAPLLRRYEVEGVQVAPRLYDLTEITEAVEQVEFRLRPDGRGYEPR